MVKPASRRHGQMALSSPAMVKPARTPPEAMIKTGVKCNGHKQAHKNLHARASDSDSPSQQHARARVRACTVASQALAMTLIGSASHSGFCVDMVKGGDLDAPWVLYVPWIRTLAVTRQVLRASWTLHTCRLSALAMTQSDALTVTRTVAPRRGPIRRDWAPGTAT